MLSLPFRNKLEGALHCAHVRISKMVLGPRAICEVRISPAGTRVSTNTTPPQIPARLFLFTDSLLFTLGAESIDAHEHTRAGFHYGHSQRGFSQITEPKTRIQSQGHGFRSHPLQSCQCRKHITPLVMGQPTDPSTKTG